MATPNPTHTASPAAGARLAAVRGLTGHPAWQRLLPRERRLVVGATVLVVLAVWWGVLIRPAWRQWTHAPAQLAQLQAQLHTVQNLAVQAKALQSQPARSRDERLAALESTTRQALGPAASLKGVGDQYTVQLTGVAPDALARWLADVRTNAQLTPEAVQWTRNNGSWQGSVRFQMGQ